MCCLTASLYAYAVTHDLGFAPNPFGGLLSLANCKPNIRARAKNGDWIVGFTGVKLRPALRCVYAMTVTDERTFDSYWSDPTFLSRRPQRSGTAKSLVGDNIYHRLSPCDPWMQEDSVHSLTNGTQCQLNTAHDTRINRVLLSNDFVYFGSAAPLLPVAVRAATGYYRNPRDYRRFDLADAKPLINWLAPQKAAFPNQIVADPINFTSSAMRYSQTLQRLV